MAEKIHFKKERELKEQQTGLRLAKHPEEINFFDYFQSFIDNYMKKDVRHMRRGLAIFKEFLEEKKYKAFVETIRPDQITKEMIREFADYLQSRFTGEGPHTLFQRFKKVFKKATEDDILAVMVVGEVLQAFPCSPSEKMSLQLTSYQYNGKIMQIDLVIKDCQSDIHNLYKWGDYLLYAFSPYYSPICPKIHINISSFFQHFYQLRLYLYIGTCLLTLHSILF